MSLPYVPLSFKSYRYLVIYDDHVTVAIELTPSLIEALEEGQVRVVDMETFQEILPDLTAEDLAEDEDG